VKGRGVPDGNVDAVPVCEACGKINEPEASKANRPVCVMVAGFQNIDDTEPPAATPA
jgi:hypothetical protein